MNTQQSSQPSLKNPFPGLRPFTIEESHLFFGREGQSEEVLHHLSKNRFVAVIGASGSGKSSLMYCGLVPILYGGFTADAVSDWKIITTRPGDQPVENLARSIAGAWQTGKEDNSDISHELTLAILQRSSLGLAEAIEQIPGRGKSNILLMVDQFEELFRYKRLTRTEASFNESESFVKLLVEAVRQKKIPVYIVLTMRSDYIGECSQFQELTRLINESNYLIPQMTRDDFRSAITGPVAVGGAQIDPNLVQQLLNEVGDNPDQLPILQHALMRTWEYWVEQNDPERPISMADYDAVGRMEKALSEHANEAFDELTPAEKQVCEYMFKTLTEKGGDNLGTRQPTRLDTISVIARAGVDEVKKVIDTFRGLGRSFLTPASHIGLTSESVIDISHESLMRIWDRLRIWVEEEAQAVQMYNRLAEASGLYHTGKTGLWRPPDLTLALNWKKKQQPTLTWAERYNPAFERAMVFLDTSEKEFIAEEENKIRLQKRQLRRSRIFAMVLGTAAIISIGFMLYAFVLRGRAIAAQIEANKQRHLADSSATIAKINEQRALDALDESERQRLRADSNATLAIYRQMQADSNATEANYQRGIAVQQTRVALERKAEADTNAAEAERQRAEAERQRQDAYNRRLLSIAQSMSVKSIQVDNDTNLKSLLAYQAYLFNDEYGGRAHHTDIYAGLYDAIGFIRGADHNVFKGHDDAVRSLVFDPGSTDFYSTGSDGRILKWSLTDKQYKMIIDNNLVNRIIAISDDGKWLVCGTDGIGIQVFDLNSGSAEPRIFNAHLNKIRALDFFPDNNRLISAGLDNEIAVWDLSNGSKQTFTEHDVPVQVLVISKDGKWMAGGTKDTGEIIMWNLEDPSQKKVIFSELGNYIWSLDYSPDGKWLVSGDRQGNVKVWDTQTKKMIINLRGHRAAITNIQFSSDGKFLATASNDGSVRLWETADLNNQPIVLSGNTGFVLSLAFSPDGNYLLTGSTEENRLLSTPTKTDILVEDICDGIERNFTREEWNAYVGEDIEYLETCAARRGIGVRKQQ
jgi:WD40 repeat protein/energy-coupling factor transporter ATP-binding protein EcfA2